ncbi:MAG: flagellar hook-length control protein FliK [Sedimentisphaerales bacterium]|nr:flagellar hook-length control protein FliK [Sedimentisphaerales bacterium]
MTDGISCTPAAPPGPRQLVSEEYLRPFAPDENQRMPRESDGAAPLRRTDEPACTSKDEIRSGKRRDDFENILNQEISRQSQEKQESQTKESKEKKTSEKALAAGQSTQDSQRASVAVRNSVVSAALYPVPAAAQKSPKTAPMAPDRTVLTHKSVQAIPGTVTPQAHDKNSKPASLLTKTPAKANSQPVDVSKDKGLDGDPIRSKKESQAAGKEVQAQAVQRSIRETPDPEQDKPVGNAVPQTGHTSTENNESRIVNLSELSKTVRIAKGKSGPALNPVQKSPVQSTPPSSAEIAKQDISLTEDSEMSRLAKSKRTLKNTSAFHKSLSELNAQVEKSASQHQPVAEASAETIVRIPRPDTTDSLRVEAATGTEKPTAVQSRLFSEARPHEQILDRIQADFRGPEKEIRLTLNPADLGRVRIHFEQTDQMITGRLEVEKSATRQEIQRHLSEIVAGLQNSGIQVRRIDVTQDHSSPNQDHRPSSQEQFEDFRQYPYEEESHHGGQPFPSHESWQEPAGTGNPALENMGSLPDDRVNIYI